MTDISLGYTIFYVDDVATTVDFFADAFGFPKRFVTPENDYGEVETGPTRLAFVSTELATINLAAAGGFAPIDTERPGAASITLVTNDVTTALKRAIEAGARPYVEPIDKPWGQTVAYVLAPSNVLIELATPVSEG